MQAAFTAGEAAIRKLRPGASNADVGRAIERVAEDYGVNVVEGVLTHAMKRYVIDGNKVVLNKSSPELRADEETIELNEVYALDIVMSSGEGKPKMQDEKETNVYKRAIEKNYKLKMQASRAVFSEISKKFPTMPFTMRAMGDVRGARLGLVECMKHELLHEYPVLYEKPGDAVAHFKATVLVMKNGNDRVTTWTHQPLESDLELTDEDLKALIQTPLKSKKKKDPFLWAALEDGIGNREWIRPFMDILTDTGLPKSDFLVLRPTVDLKGFTAQPTSLADANRVDS